MPTRWCCYQQGKITTPPFPVLIFSRRPAFAGDMTCQLVSIEIDDSNRSAEDNDEEVGRIDAGRSKIARIAPEIDWGRSARFTLVGATFLAPVLHTWFGFLARRFPGTAASSVVKRVALDQLVFAPVFLASFLSVIMLLDGNAAKVTLCLNRFSIPFGYLSSLGVCVDQYLAA